jgi:tRNA-specific 2-thiouridylase
MDMKNFLKTKIKPKKGNIVNPLGEILGKHDGVAYYTIGQRLGSRYDLNIRKDNGKKMPRWYVAKKDIENNILTVAPAGHELLYRKEIVVKNFHLINGGVGKFKKKISKKSVKVYSRIRHVGELVPSKLSFENGKVRLELSRKLDGVSNGQAVVFYKGRKVLGGGVISE